MGFTQGPPDGVSAGVGYIYSSSVYRGIDNKHLPMPFVSYKKGNLNIRGFSASYQFFEKGSFKASAIVDAKFFAGGYEDSDSPFLSGMDERKGSLYGGGSFSFELGKVGFSANLLKDMIGVHGGLEGDFGAGIDFPISIFFKSMPFTMIGLNAGMMFTSESYNNYYYGVKNSEVLRDRAAYKTTSSLSPFLRSFVRVSLSEKWTLMTIYQLTWLADEIKGSTIVDEKKKFSLIAFLTYKF